MIYLETLWIFWLISFDLTSSTNINSFYLTIVDDDDDDKVKDDVDDDDDKVKGDDDDDDDDDENDDDQPRGNLEEPHILVMLNNSTFIKKVSVILNLLSRAESTIFIATTINNQHFLQISAPLRKSEKNVNQSINPLPT